MRPRTAIVLAIILVATPASAGWSMFRHDPHHDAQAEAPGEIQAPLERWSYAADGHVLSSPAVATLGEDVRIAGATYPSSGAGTVFLLKPNGRPVWNTTPSPLTSGGFLSSPAIGDPDGDGTEAVYIGKLETSTLYALDAADGTQLASYTLGQANRDLLAASPILADVDPSSPGQEILIGGSQQGESGTVLVLSADLSTTLAALEVNAPVWSSLLATDLDGDGDDEIVASTGVPDTACLIFGGLHPTNSPKTGDDGGQLVAFGLAGGTWTQLWNTTLSGPTLASPATGDVDGDGLDEVVVGSQGPRGSCQDANNVQDAGYLHVVDAATGTLEATSDDLSSIPSISSPVIHDVDHDGDAEIVQGIWDGVRAYRASSGSVIEEKAFRLPPTPQGADEWVAASPAIGDIDGDGSTDVLALTMPINVNLEQLTESQALPGLVFAVNGTSFEELWRYRLPEDGGLSGPVLADVDSDGASEVLAGTGFPTIGQARSLHLFVPANPVVDATSHTPADPSTQDPVTFSASARDEDHDPDELAYTWRFDDGTTTQAREPTHRFEDDGAYTVVLTVTDPDGNTWTHEHTLEVTNVAPELAPTSTSEPGSLRATLHAGATDPDGTIENITWTLPNGSQAYEPTIEATFETGGSYPFQLEVTDDDGAHASTEVTANVNRAPDVTGPADANVREDDELVLTYEATDPDGDPISHAWVAGAPGAQASVDGSTIEVRWEPGYDAQRRHDLTVHVADTGTPEAPGTSTTEVRVWDVDRPPAIGSPTNTTVDAGQLGRFEGTVTDPDGDPYNLTALQLPPDATFEQAPGRWVVELQTTRSMVGRTFEIELEATDGNLTTTEAYQIRVLSNQPPVAVIDAPSMTNASRGPNAEPVLLDGRASYDPDGDPLEGWTWELDGRTRTGPAIEHVFSERGAKTIRLTVQDPRGGEDTAKATVLVDDTVEGDLDIVRPGGHTTPHHDVIVVILLERDDGDPVVGYETNLTVHHEDLEQPVAEEPVRTNSRGIGTVHLSGDMGLPFFLPGEHTVRLDAAVPSVEGAVLDDLETLTLRGTFHVTAPMG